MKIETTCKDDTAKFRVDINELMDKVEKGALAELNTTVKQQEGSLNEEEDSLSCTLQLLKAGKDECEKIKNTNIERQMFITNKKVRKTLSKCATTLKQLSESAFKLPNILFEMDDQLTALHNNLESLGRIAVSTDKTPETKTVLLNAEVESHKAITVRQSSDEKDPWITGLTFLPHGDLFIVDYNNRRLTLLDPSLTVKYTMLCQGNPWDVAVVDDKDAIVSIKDEKKLQFINFDQKLTFHRSIDIGRLCHGVSVSRDHIFVSSIENGSVVLKLNKQGEILRTFNRSVIGRDFNLTFFVAASLLTGKLFISEDTKLTCITATGSLLFSYSDENLGKFRGVIVDDEDNALVCCMSSNNIYVIRAVHFTRHCLNRIQFHCHIR